MAEKESKVTTISTETETDRPVTSTGANRGSKVTDDKKMIKKSNWIIWLVIGCVVVALLLAWGVVALIRGVQTDRPYARFTGTSTAFHQRFSLPSQQFIYSTQTSTSGPTTSTTTTTYTYTQGVVTAVNSGSIVVAGNGKSQTITTNSSTTYDNGKPVVNDNVVVVGTSDSSGAITATEINVTDN